MTTSCQNSIKMSQSSKSVNSHIFSCHLKTGNDINAVMASY